MNPSRVALIGGSGFLGSAIAGRLAETGTPVLIPTRHESRARHLLVLPTVELAEANVNDPATLAHLLVGIDAVVNLVGVLHSPPGQPWGAAFNRAHVELPRKLVAACRVAGVKRLIHISALGAAPDGPSEYQRSKAAGEAEVRAAGDDPVWTILRPSVVFGHRDHFLNLFAALARWFPVLPLAGANARFQPVYVEDVAEVVWHCLSQPGSGGQTFELGGPRVYTLRQLVRYVAELAGHPRPIVPLPEWAAMAQARLMELSPRPLMSRDNVRSMGKDNVIADGPPLPFELVPTALEAVAPSWITDTSPHRHYDPLRRRARRARG